MPVLAFGLAGMAWGGFAMRRHERAWSAYTPAFAVWQAQIAAPAYDAWRSLVEAEGFGARIPDFENGLRIAFRGEALPNGRHGVRSRVGGVPDLPSDFAWPGGPKPWTFFAQVAFDELPGAKHDLPREGALAIFHEELAGDAAVTFYFPPGVPLIERDLPSGVDLAPAIPLRFLAYQDIPDVEGCDEATTLEIREYLAGELLALHGLANGLAPDSSIVLWQAPNAFGSRTRALIEVAQLGARDFSRIVHVT